MGKKERISQKSASESAKKAQQVAAQESAESAKWSSGAKDLSKKQLEEQKKQEALLKKRERELLLAQEEKEIVASAKAAKSKDSKKDKPARGLNLDAFEKDVPEYAASGLDAALHLLDLTATSGKQQDKLERHPEKRMKSAWAAFEEREMPRIKAENPGLRLSQYKQMLQKMWKKSPENPMNQQTVAYDATRQEEREVIEETKADALEKMRVK
ncbi:hypothetical protein HDU85_007409 [Gaertneriomyces sp. JEL0708]|nr:hypothetical protein HDU85_007409 [Gaertneriomyces sp. JEL0708]